MNRTTVSTVILVAALACATAAPAHSASRTCATGGLVVWMDTNGDGAAGTVYYHLELTNLSGHTCTLRGFPGVSAVKLGGGRIGSAAGRDPATPVKTISIANGRTAKATLGIVSAGNFPSSKCRQTTAAGLRIYPPNQTASKVVPFPFAACSRTGPIFLRVRAVT